MEGFTIRSEGKLYRFEERTGPITLTLYELCYG